MTIYILGWLFFGTALATAKAYTQEEKIPLWIAVIAFLVFTAIWPWILATWIFQVLILSGRRS